jgi:flagellar biosynthesis component FlhA
VLELGEDALATSAGAAVAYLASRYGVHCGRVDWLPDPDLPEATFALRVNDRLGLPLAVPGQDEGFVLAPPERLAEVGAASARLLVGAPELGASVVDAADAEALRSQGLSVEEPVDAVLHIVEAELQRRIDDLIDVSDVENRLARLAERYPMFSRLAATLGAVPLVTEVLRALGREGVAPPALPLIVRIALEQLVEEDADGRRPGTGGPERVLAAVRGRLGRELTSLASAGTGRLGVLVVSGQPRSREDRSTVRTSAWEHWVEGMTHAVPVAVVTSDADRAAVRRTLEPELAELPVLAVGELTPDVELVQLGELSFRTA